MEDLTREYSEKEIIELTEAIKGNEEPFKWLMQNDCKELAALCDVLAYGNDAALSWLKKNEFMTLLAFVDALDDDDKAFHFLMESAHKEWAAVIDVINEGDEARQWFYRFNMKHFLLLADSLISSRTRSGGMGGFGGGGGGGGGFGGFGGGGFGGGGASGGW